MFLLRFFPFWTMHKLHYSTNLVVTLRFDRRSYNHISYVQVSPIIYVVANLNVVAGSIKERSLCNAWKKKGRDSSARIQSNPYSSQKERNSTGLVYEMTKKDSTLEIFFLSKKRFPSLQSQYQKYSKLKATSSR